MYYNDDLECFTWATIDDLYVRYGQEFIDKIATRTVYDEESGSYIADETTSGRIRVLATALSDARSLIIRKISCLYKNVEILNNEKFSAVKLWHIKLTIETLQIGGDCSACACNADLDKFLDCGNICSDNGTCLVSKKSFLYASKAKWNCECNGGCNCC